MNKSLLERLLSLWCVISFLRGRVNRVAGLPHYRTNQRIVR